MRISVAWVSEKVKAAGEIEKVRANGVRVELWAHELQNPRIDARATFQELSFDAPTITEGLSEASGVETHLKLNYGIQPQVWIERMDLGFYLCKYERVVEEVIADLKVTRNWLRDHRIASIRQKLEKPIVPAR